jgi:glycosyltransferase involved in cell wall biosynthesis
MADVVKSYPRIKCVIAGSGHEKNELYTKISELKLGEYVKIVGYRENALSLINASDIFVLPSAVDAFGLVVLEAMSLAKPVVAVRFGGPAEIVAEGQTGLLVNARDPQNLAGAIMRLLKDPRDAQAMGENGLKRFKEKYTLGHMVKETLYVYEHVVER